MLLICGIPPLPLYTLFICGIPSLPPTTFPRVWIPAKDNGDFLVLKDRWWHDCLLVFLPRFTSNSRKARTRSRWRGPRRRCRRPREPWRKPSLTSWLAWTLLRSRSTRNSTNTSLGRMEWTVSWVQGLHEFSLYFRGIGFGVCFSLMKLISVWFGISAH